MIDHDSPPPSLPEPASNALTDSAGQPWAGRKFTANASSGDDGSAPPALLSAIADFLGGIAGQSEVVEAFRASRLLIPLLAELGEAGVTKQGTRVDKSQELSIVTVEGPDGRAALPVFSSVATMGAWNAKARPVPASGPRVALAAASEGTDLVILDPGSDSEFAIRRPALWALAQERDWVPSFQSAEVAGVFADSVAPEPAVTALELGPADPSARLRGAELRVELTLIPGLDEEQLAAVLERLSSRWSHSDIIAEQVDSLEVAIRRAD